MTQPTIFGDFGKSTRQLFWRFLEQPQKVSRPLSDAQQQAGLDLLNFNNPTFIAKGLITDCTALAHCYKVQVEHGVHTITAVLASATSHSAMGARQLNTLQPGTEVWLLLHPHSYYGVIIAAEPGFLAESRRSLVDQVHLASRTRVDSAHKAPFNLLDAGGITDWTAGRPFDGTHVGEAGWIAETGMRIFLDPFMAALAASEACGIFSFYHDDLLRIAAYNLHWFTAGSDRDAKNDVAEYNDVEGWTPYPWEKLGLFSNGDPLQEFSPQATQVAQPWYARYEPQQDDQYPFHRVVDYRGYLGQGGKRQVVAPPTTPPAVNTLSAPASLLGMAEQNLGLNGRIFSRSAKGVTIAKRSGIVVPRRKKYPEDPQGDTEENYQFSSQVGDGPPHQLAGDILVMSSLPQLERAAGIADLHAYAFNWQGLHPFHYHAQDWETPQSGQLDLAEVMPPPTFSQLVGAQYMAPPAPISVKIDHREQATQIFPNESYLTMLDDGGVVLGDGFGSEIRMTGGHIFITAPGDIWLKSGRNTNVWAGFDFIMRAQNSFDMSATAKDGRIKVDGNFQLSAGNSGAGGVLIESRATGAVYDFANKTGEDVGSSGIMLRALQSPVVTWGASIYQRSLAGGEIVLDADQGKGLLVTQSSDVELYVQDSVHHYFGTNGNVQAANEFSQATNTLGASLFVDGDLQAAGGCLIEDWFESTAGHIATALADDSSNLVDSLSGLPLDADVAILAAGATHAETELPNTGQQTYKQAVSQVLYQNNQAGNATVIQFAEFNFRSEAQYRTSGFQLFEDRWQQLARAASEPATWTEKPVGQQVQWPYPGKAAFENETSYIQQALTMFNAAAGVDEARPGPYVAPQYGTQSPQSLNGTYPVILGQ